jgi:hypothetical protein
LAADDKKVEEANGEATVDKASEVESTVQRVAQETEVNACSDMCTWLHYRCFQHAQAEKTAGYTLWDSGCAGPATATARLARSRSKQNAAEMKQVKMFGVPATAKVDDYFAEGSLHRKLLEEEQVMIHSHANMEYWTFADFQMKPKIGELPSGHYYSTLVILGQSGGVTGRNHDAVSSL